MCIAGGVGAQGEGPADGAQVGRGLRLRHHRHGHPQAAHPGAPFCHAGVLPMLQCFQGFIGFMHRDSSTACMLGDTVRGLRLAHAG